MGLPNKDELKGKWEQAKGTVKEKIGHAMDDRELEEEGAAERAQGEARESFGEAKRKVGEAVKDLGETIRK